MSKRFGRNQKRAMRAQIRDHEEAIKIKNQTILELKRILNESNAVIERTSQVLGDHFVTLPVKTREVEEILNRFQVSIFNWGSCIPRSIPRSVKINQAVDYALFYIDTHQASVRFNELQQTIHMRYSCINGDVAYALSPMAWKKLSHAHLENLIAQQVAPEMARVLTERMKRFHR